MRWAEYVLTKGTNPCRQFWESYFQEEKDVLYILGVGFDPRTVTGINTIYTINGTGKRDAILLRYYQSEEEKTVTPEESVSNHQKEIIDLLNRKGAKHCIVPLIVRSNEEKSIASIKAYSIITGIDDLANYSDIVVDVSAMPRGVFIPLLNKLLQIIDESNFKNPKRVINLHVVVSENFRLDAKIEDDGTEQTAEFIHGLSIPDITNTKDFKEVWIAVLGERQLEQFTKIKTSVKPVSTCIVLPFPSENLRRGDELINFYQDKLLNDTDFDFRNIIYADEQNPFQVYRLIKNAIERYNQSFKLLGGCKVVVSSLSSKLLTIGTFLAVYEIKMKERELRSLKIGIKHVESIGHKFDQVSLDKDILQSNELFHLWVAGFPYL